MSVLTWLIANWKLVVVAALFAALGGYALTMKSQRDAIEVEYAEYRMDVAKAAALAAEKALAQTVADEKAKEKADAEHEKTVAALAADIKRLRDASPPSSVLPAAPAGSSRPDLACFERAEYLRADGEAFERLRAGARSLADEGTASTLGLDTGKRWAQEK